MTRVKICGVTTPEELRDVVELGADAVGFVVSVPRDTHRQLSVSRARTLIDSTPPFVTTVVVTMGDELESVIELCDSLQPDVIQLHGELAASDVNELRTDVNSQLTVATEPTADKIPQLAEAADAILFDSAHPDGTGGTGEVTDWERVAEHQQILDTPVILAGGLDPLNVQRAVEQASPYAVDVSSGVETDDGEKDRQLIERFIGQVRQTEVVSI